MYTQKPLLDLLKICEAFGETEKLKRHIETVISNVFIFSEHTYKVYKNDNDFFNKTFRNIFGKKERFDFTKRDFAWNKYLNSDIYIGLKPVAVVDEKLSVVDENSADEYIIVMNTFPEEAVLINIFAKNVPSGFDTFRAGERFALLHQRLPVLPSEHLDSHVLALNLCEDIFNWVSMQKDRFESGELEKYCVFMRKSVTQNLSVKNYFRDHLSVSMDIHMGNALFYKGELMLIDTFSPKESWFIKHECCDLYRLGTDIRVFLGESAWESFRDGYYNKSPEKQCPPDVAIFSTVYASLIMVPYLYYLGGRYITQAEKHLNFLRNFFQNECQHRT